MEKITEAEADPRGDNKFIAKLRAENKQLKDEAKFALLTAERFQKKNDEVMLTYEKYINENLALKKRINELKKIVIDALKLEEL